VEEIRWNFVHGGFDGDPRLFTVFTLKIALNSSTHHKMLLHDGRASSCDVLNSL
jgi:hypothetical protein